MDCIQKYARLLRIKAVKLEVPGVGSEKRM